MVHAGGRGIFSKNKKIKGRTKQGRQQVGITIAVEHCFWCSTYIRTVVQVCFLHVQKKTKLPKREKKTSTAFSTLYFEFCILCFFLLLRMAFFFNTVLRTKNAIPRYYVPPPKYTKYYFLFIFNIAPAIVLRSVCFRNIDINTIVQQYQHSSINRSFLLPVPSFLTPTVPTSHRHPHIVPGACTKQTSGVEA